MGVKSKSSARSLADIPGADVGGTSDFLPETQAAIDAARQLNPGGKPPATGTPGSEPPLPEGHVLIKLKDGRSVQMGPPLTPHALWAPKLFAECGFRGAEMMAHWQTSEVVGYIRSINGSPLPLQPDSWSAILGVMTTLGEGYKGVSEAHAMYWGELAGPQFEVVKKNLQ